MDTRTRILDAGEALMKRSGYSGFSYADIARAVEIRKASVHHHFPAKSDLALASVERYHVALRERLAAVDLGAVGLRGALVELGEIFAAAYEGPGGGCLCGSLAGDWEVLPGEVRGAVRSYWNTAIAWLATALRTDAPRKSDEEAHEAGRFAFALFEGAMLSARVLGDASLLRSAPAVASDLIRARL